MGVAGVGAGDHGGRTVAEKDRSVDEKRDVRDRQIMLIETIMKRQARRREDEVHLPHLWKP